MRGTTRTVLAAVAALTLSSITTVSAQGGDSLTGTNQTPDACVNPCAPAVAVASSCGSSNANCLCNAWVTQNKAPVCISCMSGNGGASYDLYTSLTRAVSICQSILSGKGDSGSNSGQGAAGPGANQGSGNNNNNNDNPKPSAKPQPKPAPTTKAVRVAVATTATPKQTKAPAKTTKTSAAMTTPSSSSSSSSVGPLAFILGPSSSSASSSAPAPTPTIKKSAAFASPRLGSASVVSSVVAGMFALSLAAWL